MAESILIMLNHEMTISLSISWNEFKLITVLASNREVLQSPHLCSCCSCISILQFSAVCVTDLVESAISDKTRKVRGFSYSASPSPSPKQPRYFSTCFSSFLLTRNPQTKNTGFRPGGRNCRNCHRRRRKHAGLPLQAFNWTRWSGTSGTNHNRNNQIAYEWTNQRNLQLSVGR
jgi:hypothetical protein